MPENLTPMLAQYLEIKRKHPDSILFYRMGDFYEMFMEDALTAAPVLEVQLTCRDKSAANPIPMCGIPYHAATTYLQRLLAKGFKVAICEQVEDPKAAKGLVKREVVRVVTPALIGDPDLVSDDTATVLVAACETEEGNLAVATLDLFAGTLRAGTLTAHNQLVDLFCELLPKEALIPDGLKGSKWWKDIPRLFPQLTQTVRNGFFDKQEPLNALAAYVKETQKVESLPYLGAPGPLFEAESMTLDATTLVSLEILKEAEGRGNSLYEVLDFMVTPMGRRLMREWLSHPLCNTDMIEERQEAIAALLENPGVCEALREPLANIRDLERLSSKTALGLSLPRDLGAIRDILEILPKIKFELKRSSAPLLKKIGQRIDGCEALKKRLSETLQEELPATLRDGGVIRDSFHPEVAELRALSHDAKSRILAMETRERERTGIGSLKIKYSKVFGYLIEITNSHLTKVPQDYIRKQTIAGGERFLTPELKAFEEKILTSDFRLKSLEESLFKALRADVAAEVTTLLGNARYLAQLDVLLALTEAARRYHYKRPNLHEGVLLDISEGRHPVVERLLPVGEFVPNSLRLDEIDCRTLIITGPNMAGKSTIMRQIAIICLLAQVGSFVPAADATLPVLDAIFTRIGASDDLSRGRSTFMVEMSEMNRILERATKRSLVLIDEIGRGTSTYDGLSLAWSILEYLHTEVGAKTLFATHFHEVTALERCLPLVKNASVLVERWNDEIVFLHRMGPGICNQSYGVDVAKLAGLPPKLLSRAREILGVLESQSQRGTRKRGHALETQTKQLGLFESLISPENRSSIET